MTVAYIGIGSNMGNKEENINEALDRLGNYPGIKLLRAASLYETAPWGNLDQDWFLNTVAEIDTNLPPLDLLQALLEIEKYLGRTREVVWGPRTMDLDLLLYGQEKIDLPQLQVPHPRLTERAFVLVPLAELCPDMVLPEGKLKDLVDGILPEQEIKRVVK